ncbi:MAG: GIY-YIG nuclease family protein [Bacteroidales bacterium]
MVTFAAYVLYSKNYDKIYIGYTSDINRRLLDHNERARKGWTKHYRPWELLFSESFATKSEAIRREKQLKSAQGRKFIREEVFKKYGTS